MSFKNDWMERQIASLANAVIYALFGKKKLENMLDEYEEQENTSGGDLGEDNFKLLVNTYLNMGEINKADNYVFSYLELDKNKTVNNLLTSLFFYNELLTLHQKDPTFLEKHDFSEEEVKESIKDLSKMYSEN